MYDSGVSGGGEVELQDGLVAWDELRGDGRLSDGGQWSFTYAQRV
jgi:hypothetical protein